MNELVQYGALGIVAIVVLAGLKFVGLLVKRAAATFDAQARTLDRIATRMDKSESRASARHVRLMRRLDGHAMPEEMHDD